MTGDNKHIAPLPNITFLGAGRMGGAMLQMLSKNKDIAPSTIQVVSRSPEGQQKARALGFSSYQNLSDIENLSGYLIIAIKPHQFREQFEMLQQQIGDKTLTVISVMAGVPAGMIAKLGKHVKVVRAMPNTPSAIGAGVTALYAENISEQERARITQLFFSFGYAYWCDVEEDMHVATAISGSGSAYGFSMLRALYEAAKNQGMDETLAYEAALHTVKGAVLLAEQSREDFEMLADQVTSPNGTTRAARDVLDEALLALIEKTVQAAKTRSIAMAEELEN